MNFVGLKRDRWDGGKLFAFSAFDGPTDYAEGLVARSRFDKTAIDVLVPAACTIDFACEQDVANCVAGDWFEIGRTIRGVFLDAWHLLIEGSCHVSLSGEGLRFITNGNKTLIGVTSHFDESNICASLQEAWHARRAWMSALPSVDFDDDTESVAYAKAVSQMKTQVCSPEGAMRHRWTTPDRWPHRDMWLWDSAFHAIGLRHLDPEMAREAISAVMDCQASDGFIPHQMSPGWHSAVTQPPVLALAALLVDEVAPHLDWLAAIYPKLCAYVAWDMKNRDADGDGLLEWCIEGDPMCRSGESGMDNSPRFNDSAKMDAVDFSSLLACECETLATMADKLGRGEDSARWTAEHDRICRMIRTKLWSDSEKFFVDYDQERNQQSSVIASSGFFPLVCGAATREQADHLVASLTDPQLFGTATRLASIAVRDCRYAKDMWRGPVWVNVNWLVARGLDRYGHRAEAAELRQQTCQMIEAGCAHYGTMFEFYDDRNEVDPPQLLRKGSCNPADSPYHQVFHDYGWTATLYVDLVHDKKRQLF